MNVLVLGGTVFLGRAVVDEALARGATVTVFNRGRSGQPPAGVAHVIGDRTVPADLAQLRGRGFDIVIDTCGYARADVAASASLLASSADRYVFVSSISVYPGWPEERDYHARGVGAGDDSYGDRKAACELAVIDAFGAERCTVLRAGAIVGPHDSVVGRLPWWLDRVARGGEVLVPGTPADPVALIDARDLAAFALDAVLGTFDAPGPPSRDTRADLLAACVAATGVAPSFTYMPDEWLARQGVEGWTEMPLWSPAGEAPGLFSAGGAAGEAVARAEAAGLRWRPLAETVSDTWDWQRGLPGGWRPTTMAPGLEPVREEALLAAWTAESRAGSGRSRS